MLGMANLNSCSNLLTGQKEGRTCKVAYFVRLEALHMKLCNKAKKNADNILIYTVGNRLHISIMTF